MNGLFRIIITTVLTVMLGVSVTIAAQADELRLTTQPSPFDAPIFVARHKGWVEEELAKVGAVPAVKWTSFAAGPPMNESFAAGQQDIGFLGDTPAIIGKSAGIDTRIIGLTASGPKTLAVIVPTKSNIRSPRDLKGKKVSVAKGSYAHHLLVLVLEQGGLTTNDIKFINMSQADTATAIVNGDVEAAAVWEPLITALETQGAVRVLADGTGIKKGLLVIVATSDFAAKHREQVKAVLRAYQRGAEFIRSNPKAAAQLVTADVHLSAPLLLKIYPKFNFNPIIKAEDIGELKKSEAFMRNDGLIRRSVNIDAFVDLGVNRESNAR